MSNMVYIINSVGWALISFTWQAALIVGAYWLVTRTVPKNYYTFKYWTGMLTVGICLLIPFYHLANTDITVISQNSFNLLGPTIASTVVAIHQTSITEMIPYFINLCLPYFVIAWAMLVIVLSCNLIHTWMNLKKIFYSKEKHVNDTSKINEIMHQQAQSLGLLFAPVLKITQHVNVPATFGFFKPVILLPVSIINRVPIEQIEMILLHELCHIKRHDFVHNLLQLLTDTLFFFHPAIKWMNKDIRHIREQCCDQMVLKKHSDPLLYAHALTNVAEINQDEKVLAQIQIGLKDGHLIDRIRAVLVTGKKSQSITLLLPLILLVFILYSIVVLENGSDETEMNNSLNIDKLVFSSPSFDNNRQKSYYFSPNQKVFQLPTIKPRQNNQEIKPALSQTTKQNNYKKSDVTSSTQPISTAKLNNQALSNEIVDEIKSDINSINSDSAVVSPIKTEKVEKRANQYKAVPSEDLKANPADQKAPTANKIVQPKYPSEYLRKGAETKVIVNFQINKSGKPFNIDAKAENQEYLKFEKAVTKALKKWRFDPQSLTSEHLKATFTREFNFVLSGDNKTAQELKECKREVITGTRLKRTENC